MNNFKTVLEYTDYLLSLPEGEDKTIKLFTPKKAMSGALETRLEVEPYRNKYGKTLGALDSLSREQQESAEYLPHGVFKSISGETVKATRVTIVNGTEFDLNNEIDRKNWEFVKYCPYIVLNLEDFANNKRAMFYIELPMAVEAKTKLGGFEVKLKAMDLIKSSPSVESRFVAKMLGYSLEEYDDAVIKSWLYELANSSVAGAQKVIDTIDTPDYVTMMLILKAIEFGVIINDSDMYIFNDSYLGKTLEQVKSYFKDDANKPILEEVNKAVKSFKPNNNKRK